jgi:hypothetical protein
MPVLRIKGKEPKSEVIEFELTQDDRGNVSLWANDIMLMKVRASDLTTEFTRITGSQTEWLHGLKWFRTGAQITHE